MTDSYAFNELLFPESPFPGQPHDAINGIRYIWDDDKKSWIIDPAAAASTDYVNQAVQNKVDRGGDFLYGSLSFKEQNNVTLGDTFRINNTGTVTFFKDRKVECFPGGKLSFSHNNKTVFDYDGNGITTNQPITTGVALDTGFTPGLSGTHFNIVGDLKDNTTYGLTLNTSNTCQFLIKGGSGILFKVSGGDDGVVVRGNSTKAFRVNNSGGNSVFRVDNRSNVIDSSSYYNDQLKDGANGFTNETLLSTIGFVNSKIDDRIGDFGPGKNVCASSESEAEVGGFWISGGTLYIKVA